MIIHMSEEEKSLLSIIEGIAERIYPPHGTHGWEHIQRVCSLSMKIAEKESCTVEEFPLMLSCLLHDIARYGKGTDHALESAVVAEEILRMAGIEEDVVRKVRDAISSHSYSSKRKPESCEGMVLSDADKVDALGAIGIARVFEYSGENGRTLKESVDHFREKILKLPEMMYTEEGKKLARERALFVEEFLRRLLEEVEV